MHVPNACMEAPIDWALRILPRAWHEVERFSAARIQRISTDDPISSKVIQCQSHPAVNGRFTAVILARSSAGFGRSATDRLLQSCRSAEFDSANLGDRPQLALSTPSCRSRPAALGKSNSARLFCQRLMRRQLQKFAKLFRQKYQRRV